jgi:L-asparagine oxygenase
MASQASASQLAYKSNKKETKRQQDQEPSAVVLPVFRLSEEQAEVLNQELSKVPVRGYQRDPSKVEGPGGVDPESVEKFEESSFQALENAKFRPVFEMLKHELQQSGMVMIKNVDYGPVAPTTQGRAMHGSAAPEALISGLARMFGCKMVGYEDQIMLNTHDLFHDIRAVKTGREGANGAGGLGMHMDVGFRPDIRPNLFFLACLREGQDLVVQTPLVTSKHLYLGLLEKYPEDEQVLRDATAWNILSPATSGSYPVLTPLLTGTKEDPVFHLRLDRMEPLNDDARRALDHLLQLVKETELGIHLQYGDLLLINNHKVLHRRSPFKASYDEHDRLLMRAYAKEASSVPCGRIHSPLHPELLQDLAGRSLMMSTVSGRQLTSKL